MKEYGFTLKNARSRWYSAQTITDTDYVDDIALLANILIRAKSLLHCLVQAAGGFGLHLTSDKIEYMCFNQKGDVSTQNGGSLKLVNKFIYIWSSISSTENDINMQLVNAWTAIDILSIIWKSIGGARGVVVIVVGNGHSDTSSNPGRDWLHFT